MLIIQPLSTDHCRNNFDCGDLSLNSYLYNIAMQHMAKDISKTFVLCDSIASSKIIGYITFTSCEIEPKKDIPEYIVKKFHYPTHKIPATRLSRLAVQKEYQSMGYGKKLLMYSLQKTYIVSTHIPTSGIIVDAINNDAKNFYSRFGFIELTNKPLTMFLHISTIKALFY